MLRDKVGEESKLKTHGFLLAVDTEEDVNVEHLAHKLGDALTWVEGVGNVDVNYLGEIEIVDDVPIDAELIDGQIDGPKES